MRKLACSFLIFVSTFFLFAKEKILAKKDYPKWIEHVQPNSKNNDWGGFSLIFEDEIIEKIAKDGKNFIIYYSDGTNEYRVTCNKNGFALKKEQFTKKNNLVSVEEYYLKPPYNIKYYKTVNSTYFPDALDPTIEYWQDELGKIIKWSDPTGVFEYKYDSDGSYIKKCIGLREDKTSLMSNIGSLQYFDKNDNLLSIIPNLEIDFQQRYMIKSPDFQSLIREYKLKFDIENNSKQYYWQTYKSGYGEVFWITNNDWNNKHIIFEYSNSKINWLDENGNCIHGIDKKTGEEWWNTYQNNNLIYNKDSNGTEVFMDYDANNNICSEKIKTTEGDYIYNYKYDSENRVIETIAKHVDNSDKILSSMKTEQQYDAENFVVWVKWTVQSTQDGHNWSSSVNNHTFTDINESLEYKFEKLSETQFKVIPQDGRHWFVVEKDF